MDNNKFGNFLQLRRLQLKKKQGEMAEIAGLEQSVISRLENGKTKKPTIETLGKLALALDVPLMTLASFLEREKGETLNFYPFIEALARSNCTILSLEDIEFLLDVQKRLPEPMTIPLIEELLRARKPKTDTPT